MGEWHALCTQSDKPKREKKNLSEPLTVSYYYTVVVLVTQRNFATV